MDEFERVFAGFVADAAAGELGVGVEEELAGGVALLDG